MKSRTVYAVTEGWYSDYTVRALFTSRDAAEEHRLLGGGDDVSEFVLIEEGQPEKVIWWRAAQIIEPHFSERQDVRVWSGTTWNYGPDQPPKRPRIHDGGRRVMAFGSDREAVVKAAADRVAQIRAHRAGLA